MAAFLVDSWIDLYEQPRSLSIALRSVCESLGQLLHNDSSDDTEILRSNPVFLVSTCLSKGPISTVDSPTCSHDSESGGPSLTLYMNKSNKKVFLVQFRHMVFSIEFSSYLGESPGQTKNSRILTKPKDTCFVLLPFVELVWVCFIQVISYFGYWVLFALFFRIMK